MLSFYYKKQEESKKLEEDSEDAYMNSAWANPKNLKKPAYWRRKRYKLETTINR